MKVSGKAHDLVALVAILAAGVVLIALGVEPGSLGTITIALAAVYAAWASGGRPNSSGSDKQGG